MEIGVCGAKSPWKGAFAPQTVILEGAGEGPGVGRDAASVPGVRFGVSLCHVRVLNLRCGDDLRETLGPAGYEGEYLAVTDPLCQGPVPAEAAGFDHVRAAWICEGYGVPFAEAQQRVADERAAVDGLEQYDEVRLWFEHDWFDQAILIGLLARLAMRPEVRKRLTLITINGFPGVDRFHGLGQLDADQLATLRERFAPVTEEQFACAEGAFAALRAADPHGLVELAGADSAALPLLPAALRRHLAELPWTTDGLSLSERLCLRGIAGGARTPAEVFQAHQDADPQPYLGDSMLAPVLRRLSQGDRPALVDGELTEHGALLLDGEGWWSTPSRWVGGVAVGDRGWRWDADSATAVAPD